MPDAERHLNRRGLARDERLAEVPREHPAAVLLAVGVGARRCGRERHLIGERDVAGECTCTAAVLAALEQEVKIVVRVEEALLHRNARVLAVMCGEELLIGQLVHRVVVLRDLVARHIFLCDGRDLCIGVLCQHGRLALLDDLGEHRRTDERRLEIGRAVVVDRDVHVAAETAARQNEQAKHHCGKHCAHVLRSEHSIPPIDLIP